MESWMTALNACCCRRAARIAERVRPERPRGPVRLFPRSQPPRSSDRAGGCIALATFFVPAAPARAGAHAAGRTGGHATNGHGGADLHLLARAHQDAQARARGRPARGHGPHAGGVRGRVHGQGGGRVCHAPVGHGRERGGRGPGLSGQDARHAEADGPPGDGCRVVSLPPGLWVLALGRGHQHPAELRAAHGARRGGGRGPHPVGQGQGGDGCVPAHQPPDAAAGAGAPPDDVQRRAPEQAVDPGAHPRPQPALLLDRHQLPQERARGPHAPQPAEEVLDGRHEGRGLLAAPEPEREGRGRAEEPHREVRQVCGGGDGDDAGGARGEERGEDERQEAPAEQCAGADGLQHHPVPGHAA